MYNSRKMGQPCKYALLMSIDLSSQLLAARIKHSKRFFAASWTVFAQLRSILLEAPGDEPRFLYHFPTFQFLCTYPSGSYIILTIIVHFRIDIHVLPLLKLLFFSLIKTSSICCPTKVNFFLMRRIRYGSFCQSRVVVILKMSQSTRNFIRLFCLMRRWTKFFWFLIRLWSFFNVMNIRRFWLFFNKMSIGRFRYISTLWSKMWSSIHWRWWRWQGSSNYHCTGVLIFLIIRTTSMWFWFSILFRFIWRWSVVSFKFGTSWTHKLHLARMNTNIYSTMFQQMLSAILSKYLSRTMPCWAPLTLVIHTVAIMIHSVRVGTSLFAQCSSQLLTRFRSNESLSGFVKNYQIIHDEIAGTRCILSWQPVEMHSWEVQVPSKD